MLPFAEVIVTAAIGNSFSTRIFSISVAALSCDEVSGVVFRAAVGKLHATIPIIFRHSFVTFHHVARDVGLAEIGNHLPGFFCG